MKKKALRTLLNWKTEPIRIRLARPTDAASIAGLSTQLGYPISSRDMKKRITTVTRRKDQKLYAAVISRQVVGWLEIFLPLSVLNKGKAEVGALVVDDHYRRYGVGSVLMQKAHEWAQKNHCPFVYLRSNIIRKEAHVFYGRMGYSVYKTQYVFRKLF